MSLKILEFLYLKPNHIRTAWLHYYYIRSIFYSR